jgi:hypothetical protein
MYGGPMGVSMAKIGYFIPKSAILHNQKYFLTKS